MADDIQVRTVRVEFLRAGPAHNQLLSPLTPYLAVCDDAEAGVVHVPFEQHTFERRMRAMRHEDQSEDRGKRPPQKDRLPELRELGVAMAKLLGSVPRFPGSLSADPNGRDTVLRVSLTLSASELAGLPFELAKVPIGPDACTDSWLSLQSKLPVVITRRTRNVSQTRMAWLECPRVLFVCAGEGSGEVPYEAHLKVLMLAVKPFALSNRFGQRARLQTTPDADGLDVRKTHGDILTVLANATLDGVVRECADHAYTHVHILAHGDRDTSLGDGSFGLRLHPDDGVISGERLASALTGMVHGKLHRPQVVTLATCNSGTMEDFVNPGASIAHVLHQAGIPLVVASQVPLGFEASVLFTELFYSGLLWGEHPWVLMHRVRSTLHGRLGPMDHDWASLVVYESLPSDMTDALERAAFEQCRRAIEVAYASGRWVSSEDMNRAIERLVDNGKTYAMEARALRADRRMINARDETYDVREHPQARSETELRESFRYQRWCMEEAMADYDRAVVGYLVTMGQGLNAPFRALLAKFSIQLVLGKPLDWADWHVARFWAQTTVRESDDAQALGWAHASLCELWLLRLLDSHGPGNSECLRRASAELRQSVRNRQPLDRFTSNTTDWLDYRLAGYVGAWSQPELRAGGSVEADADLSEDGGIATPLDLAPLPAAAQRLLKLLNSLLGTSERWQDGQQAPASPDSTAQGPAPAPATEKPPAGIKPPGRKKRPTDISLLATQEPGLAAGNTGQDPAGLNIPAKRPAGPTASRLLGASAPAASTTPVSGPSKPSTPNSRPSPGPAPKPRLPLPADAIFDIEMLPAAQGDCLWVEWGSKQGQRFRMLMDCGTESSFKSALGPRIAKLPNGPDQRHFELFILSHIDGDHIGGGIALLQQAKALGVSFEDIWFNGRHHLVPRTKLSGIDGDDFSKLLVREKQPWNRFTGGQAIVRPLGGGPNEISLPQIDLQGGMRVTLLSPIPSTLAQLASTWDEDLAGAGERRHLAARVLERETDLDKLVAKDFDPDNSKPNGSSIAVLLEFAGKRVLLGADAYADVLASAMKRLLKPGETRVALDAFKLSHHGSRGNVHDSLMSLVSCENYLVSTSSVIFQHPDREALARVVRHSALPPTLWFNYPVPVKQREYHAFWQKAEVQKRWKFQARYPAVSGEIQKISLLA